LFVQEENELIVKSRTGTGKTLSFLLPLEFLLKHGADTENSTRGKVQAIILEPTRELAT
jgi:superfamily II DNA/RNA helicase